MNTQTNITETELKWATEFIARNENGLFRFSDRQIEVLAIVNNMQKSNWHFISNL